MRPAIDPIPSGVYPLDGGTFDVNGTLFRLAERKHTKGRPAYYLTTEHHGFVSSLFPCDNGADRYRFDYLATDGTERAAYLSFTPGEVVVEDRGQTRRSRKGSEVSGGRVVAPWKRNRPRPTGGR